jgi:hypothetical protein
VRLLALPVSRRTLEFIDLKLLLQDHSPELFDFRTRGWRLGVRVRA